MKTALVTGGTGYIGRHLIKRLIAENIRVVSAVRRTPSNDNEHQINDFFNPAEWKKHLGGVDFVIHLAAIVHKPRENESAIQKTNVELSAKLAQAAGEAGVAQFIFMSSIAAIGKRPGAVLNEETIPQPSTPYGRSKLEAELSIAQISSSTKMAFTILRPPLVYGPGAPGNFHRLENWVAAGRPFPSIGSNSRTFVHIDNLIEAVICCVGNPSSFGNAYVVADPKPMSTNDLIRYAASLHNKKPRLVPFPTLFIKTAAAIVGRSDLAEQLIGNLKIDSSKFTREIGWHPPFAGART